MALVALGKYTTLIPRYINNIQISVLFVLNKLNNMQNDNEWCVFQAEWYHKYYLGTMWLPVSFI